MGTLLWSDFLRFAQDFLLKSDQLNDGWSLLGDSFNEGGAYLKKIVYRNISNQYSNINKTWVSEYHICYSVSYQVPVVYFNMTDESGALIKLEQIWDICKFNTRYICYIKETRLLCDTSKKRE